MHTAESDSAVYDESSDPNFSKKCVVCITPRSLAPQCASHCGVKLHGVHHTAKSKYTPGSQNKIFSWFLVAFKGTIMRNPFRGEHFYCIIKENILTP